METKSKTCDGEKQFKIVMTNNCERETKLKESKARISGMITELSNSYKGSMAKVENSQNTSETSNLSTKVVEEKRELLGWEVTFTISNSQPGERWRGVEGYENYCVSNHGRVWSIKSELYLKPDITSPKSPRVTLCKSGKMKRFNIQNLLTSHYTGSEKSEMIVRYNSSLSGNSYSVRIPTNHLIPTGVFSGTTSTEDSHKAAVAKTKISKFAFEIPSSIDKNEQKIYGLCCRELELWCDIKGYENYQVSSLGNIWSKNCDRELKPYVTGSKYECIDLYKLRKKNSFSVHILVAAHFIGLIPEKYQVDHLDHKRAHNCVKNLMIKTARGNALNKLTKGGSVNEKPVLQYSKYPEYPGNIENPKEFVDEEPIGWFPNLKAAAADDTVKLKSGWGISKCCSGRQKTAGGFRWQFAPPDPEKIFVKRDDEEVKSLGIIDGRDFSAYEMTSQGRIKRKDQKVTMTPNNHSGYDSITLRCRDKDGTGTGKRCSMRIHRLMGILFRPGRTEERNVINHINEVKTANNLENLQWTTQQENTAHSMGIAVNLVDPNGNIAWYNSLAKAFREIHRNRDTKMKPHLNTGKLRHGYFWYEDSHSIPDVLIGSDGNEILVKKSN